MIILLASSGDIPYSLAPVDKLACVGWWGGSMIQSAIHPSSKSDHFSSVPGNYDKMFEHPHCAIFFPSTSRQRQLRVHHSLDIRRSLHCRAGGYEVSLLFIRYLWQHPHELFCPPVSHDPYDALFREGVSADGTPTTFGRPSFTTWTPIPAKCDISADVGTCPFGTKAAVLSWLRCMFSSLSRRRAPLPLSRVLSGGQI